MTDLQNIGQSIHLDSLHSAPIKRGNGYRPVRLIDNGVECCQKRIDCCMTAARPGEWPVDQQRDTADVQIVSMCLFEKARISSELFTVQAGHA
jgi:hypothetical protein